MRSASPTGAEVSGSLAGAACWRDLLPFHDPLRLDMAERKGRGCRCERRCGKTVVEKVVQVKWGKGCLRGPVECKGNLYVLFEYERQSSDTIHVQIK